MKLDLEMIARITAATLPSGTQNLSIVGISTDSRKIKPGELFIPLRGERFDGHDYLSQAVLNGAAACLSEELTAGFAVPVLQVDDSLRALGELASAVRLQLRGPLIAVTGSVGKTTTKEMLAAILSRTGAGLKTAGNLNNLIGLPLTLFDLKEEHRWAVLEMGTSALGEIERLTEIASPDLGVITNVGPAHLETLKSLDGVARAKGELFAGLKGGTAIVNLDDERVARLPVANGVKRITYGLDASAEVRATEILERHGHLSFRLLLPEGAHLVKLQVSGYHNVSNALGAAAAAWGMGISGAEISCGLAAFVPIPGRMKILPLPGGGELLDDSYNANPLSVAAALQTLATTGGRGRRIAVLGDMLELGGDEQRFHYEIGGKVAVSTDLLITVGALSHQTARGARDAGLKSSAVIELENCDSAISTVGTLQQPGDRILVKGSHSMQLERLVAALLQHDERPTPARQGG